MANNLAVTISLLFHQFPAYVRILSPPFRLYKPEREKTLFSSLRYTSPNKSLFFSCALWDKGVHQRCVWCGNRCRCVHSLVWSQSAVHTAETPVCQRERATAVLRERSWGYVYRGGERADSNRRSLDSVAAGQWSLSRVFTVGGCRRCFRENQDWARQQRHQSGMAPRQSGDQATAQEREGSESPLHLHRDTHRWQFRLLYTR